MTYPVPDRLAPIRAEVRLQRGVVVLAVVAVVLAVLAGLDVSLGSVSPFDLLAFAVAALALHFVVPVAGPWRRP